MSQVRWWIKDKEEAKRLGKRNGYIRSEVSDILFDWDDNGIGRGGIKFIKVSYGRSDFIEFNLYHMEKFQKGLREHNPEVIIIYDRYDLVTSGMNLVSPTVEKMIMNILKSYNKGRRRHELDKTLDLDQINSILMEIDDLLESYDDYAIMDILTGEM
ncbi:MAG: hypothetical protein K0R18_325 [Bacillales bacterium]|jgi:hypothetical protein|nr:hypothetical protein [Bacillales bacterium]